MELMLSKAGRLKAEIRLNSAIKSFYEPMGRENKAIFDTYRAAATSAPPTLGDISRVAAEFDRQGGGTRPCGGRFKRILEAMQQFAAVGDLLVSSSQNVLAAGVWAVARVTITVIIGYKKYREEMSELFLEIGRTAPRHAELATIYNTSRKLQTYMIEYSIAVVELCKHVFPASNSCLGQLKTSLKAAITDPALLRHKASLAQWAREIREEISVIKSKELQELAKTTESMWSLLVHKSGAERQRQRLRDRVAWLDACTDFDHEKHHKLLRRRGNTHFFLDESEYRAWKTGVWPRSLFCAGRLGSGKSVLMANLVDDLRLSSVGDDAPHNAIVAFFFVSDDSASQRARTVLGGLARQILQALPSGWTDLLEGQSLLLLSLDALTAVLCRVVPPKTSIYLILDGFDEFPQEERVALLEQFKEVQSYLHLHFCISVRQEASNRAKLDFAGLGDHATIEIPKINPEIAKFVSEEVEALVEAGDLRITDDVILEQIRQRLVEGSDGMFLWVSLQLQAICLENEASVHEALDNLPESLPEVFRRILIRSQPLGKHHQLHVLKILVGVFRPLTAPEFCECLTMSVQWHNGKSPSRRHPSNLTDMLASCGSLVFIDEDDYTVHLVHPSVRQFLLGAIKEERMDKYQPWQFSHQDSQMHMAAVTMSYLDSWSDNLKVARVLNQTQTSAASHFAPSKVALPNASAIQNATSMGLAGSKTARLMQRASKVSRAARDYSGLGLYSSDDLKDTAERLWPERFNKTPASQSKTAQPGATEFLAYARMSWMKHSASIDTTDGGLFELWARLLQTTDPDDWARWDNFAREPTLHYGSTTVPKTMLWAVVHSHTALLDAMLARYRGRQRLELLLACLQSLLDMASPALSPGMAGRLLLAQLLLRRDRLGIARLLLRMQPDFKRGNYACLLAAVVARDYHTTREILHSIRDPAVVADLSYPLIEYAVDCVDVHILHLLMTCGARMRPHDDDLRRHSSSALERLIARLTPECHPSIIMLVCWLLAAGWSPATCPPYHRARALVILRKTVNQAHFNPDRYLTAPRFAILCYHLEESLWQIAASNPDPGRATAGTITAILLMAASCFCHGYLRGVLILLCFPLALNVPVALVRLRLHSSRKKARTAGRALPPVARASPERCWPIYPPKAVSPVKSTGPWKLDRTTNRALDTEPVDLRVDYRSRFM